MHLAHRVARARRVIVKLGSAVVAEGDGSAAAATIASLAESLARARTAGRDVIVVSSGAVAVGAGRLRARSADASPDIPTCAAVGQSHLMGLYAASFARCGAEIAQVLLTEPDVRDAERLAHVLRVLDALTARGVVPILNENDVVVESAAGPRASRRLRDNDHLGAVLAAEWPADVLVLLSSVDGVMTARPAHGREERVPIVARIDAHANHDAPLWRGRGPGRGGMHSKLAAARHAACRGATVIIANGRTPGIIDRILDGEPVGTWITTERTHV